MMSTIYLCWLHPTWCTIEWGGMTMTRILEKYFPALMLAGLLLPLLVMGYVGQYSRLIADDYCTTARALSDGVFGSMSWWYNNWAGQFTNWILKGAAAFMGIGFTGLLPALVLAAWLFTAAWALYQLALAVRLPSPRRMAMIGACLLVFAVFGGTPSRLQSLYWLGAVIPYTLPLIFFSALVGILSYDFRRNPSHTPLCAIQILSLIHK
jgi:hypothetical protein